MTTPMTNVVIFLGGFKYWIALPQVRNEHMKRAIQAETRRQ